MFASCEQAQSNKRWDHIRGAGPDASPRSVCAWEFRASVWRPWLFFLDIKELENFFMLNVLEKIFFFFRLKVFEKFFEELRRPPKVQVLKQTMHCDKCGHYEIRRQQNRHITFCQWSYLDLDEPELVQRSRCAVPRHMPFEARTQRPGGACHNALELVCCAL